MRTRGRRVQRRRRFEDYRILAFERSPYRKDARQYACSRQQTRLRA